MVREASDGGEKPAVRFYVHRERGGCVKALQVPVIEDGFGDATVCSVLFNAAIIKQTCFSKTNVFFCWFLSSYGFEYHLMLMTLTYVSSLNTFPEV